VPIITRTLSSSLSDDHDDKRARLIKSEDTPATIEARILSGAYASLSELREDVLSVQKDLNSAETNGNAVTTPDTFSKVFLILDKCAEALAKRSQLNGDVPHLAPSVPQQPKQFISLRSQVGAGAQVLYSGLQTAKLETKQEEDDTAPKPGPSLPNGFELTDFTTLGKHAEKKLDRRTFEKVYLPTRRVKQLDLPHTGKDVVRSTILDFIPTSSRAENLPLNKHDYKYAKLSTGTSLSYQQAGADTKSSDASSSAGGGLKIASTRKNTIDDVEDLFASVYSSFAPTSDNAGALVSTDDYTRKWWRDIGEAKLSKILHKTPESEYPDLDDGKVEDEFADLANYNPEEETLPYATTDDTLETISEMLEILSSYQRNRSLEHMVQGKVQKPSGAEFDMFEMLKTQLKLLIGDLPPFALAKLDGDQLEELSISTRIVVEAPDYPGTLQVEDYNLRRQKLVQQTQQAIARPTATPQPVRPNYASVQANTMSYNSQNRNYNTATNAAYGARNTQTYQTPIANRTGYQPTPYPASNSYSANRPTIQQFQRPNLQNGYSSYGNNNNTNIQPSNNATQTPSSAYAQRPSQPGYQQRAQDNAVARSASPQKPPNLVNGAGQHYAPRTYQTQGQSAASYAYGQRQGTGTGTPTTPITTVEVGNRPNGTGVAGQTVEASR
jgi:hypothetical protein